MEIGIVEIDIQHRNLLDIIGMLDDVVKDESYGKKSKRILREFNRFVRYHFKTEEDMFIEYGYIDEEHINQHNSILNKLDGLNDIECGHKCLVKVLEIAKHLFNTHTMVHDKKFSIFLKNQENK